MTTGDVELTVLDGGGAVVVPSSSVQVVLGCSSSGTAAQTVATRNPNTLVSVFGQGPLVEYAALCIAKGGTAICLKTATNTAGRVLGDDSAAQDITSSTNATPIVVTKAGHGLKTGDVVTIAGHLVNTAAVGSWVIKKLTTDTFSLLGSIGNGVGGATGTFVWNGVNVLDGDGAVADFEAVSFDPSAVLVSGEAYDTYHVRVLFTAAGTFGTAGIKFKISLDAGRSYGPVISLGTALTFEITDTGLTLTFETGRDISEGAYVSFTTVPPLWATSGIQACLNALQASAYRDAAGLAVLTGDLVAADAATVQAYLETLTDAKIYMRMVGNARDASPPAAWGGEAETEADWMDDVMTDYSQTAAKRICVTAGHYNIPSKIPKALAGAPRYRRPLSYALAARQVTIQPQKHAGRVKDGNLTEIVTSPTTDPIDGFVYHDEALNPGFNDAKFASAKIRPKKKGWWIDNPKLMHDTGSVFTMLPLGLVMDIACGIVNEIGTDDINEDVRLNDNGTLYDNEAIAIEKRMGQALKTQMLNKNMISNYLVVVDRANDVKSTSEVNIAVTIWSRGYILQENITIGFGSSAES